METLLITGASGFIGKNLLKKYLSREITLYLLTEHPFIPSLQRFVDSCKPKARVYLVVGDITKPDLGLSSTEKDEVLQKTTKVLHLAAAYSLTLPRSIGWKVNVEGTENLLHFMEKMPRLERLGYLSTTAISGDHRGFFGENDFDVGQKFKNYYEETKFEAEKKVREKMNRFPTTIFRPTIVVGDSRTGEMEKIDGPYYGFVMISRKLHVVLQKAPDVKCHLEPVDFVVNAIAALMEEPRATGQTVHLADPNPLNYDEFFDLVCERWRTFKPFLRLPAQMMYPLFFLPGFGKLTGIPRQSFVYTMVPVDYGRSCMEEQLAHEGIRCPPVTEYIDVMICFFRERSAKKFHS